MSKWSKGLIVSTFILVLAMAGFLLWKELRSPQAATAGKIGPVVDTGRSILKTEAEWVQKLEEKYLNLKSKLNEKAWAGVAAHYGSDVVVTSKSRSKEFKGGTDIAWNFWKPQFDKAPGKKIVDFKVKKVDIHSVDFHAILNRVLDRLNQVVVFRGVLTTEASPAEDSDFYGMAGHIQSCPDIIFCEIF